MKLAKDMSDTCHLSVSDTNTTLALVITYNHFYWYRAWCLMLRRIFYVLRVKNKITRVLLRVKYSAHYQQFT